MSQSGENAEPHPFPPTVSSLTADLRALGVEARMTLLVHTSLRAIADWVVGGAQAVILALEAVIGPEGTLVMPTMTGELSDPASWQHPPVPEDWWELIRREMPPFMPDLSVTREMGAVAETFRKQDGVIRSNHPQTSFVAWGKHAAYVTADHALEAMAEEGSPIGRIYDLGGYVLLLGVGHGNNTSLHLAEERAHFPGKRTERVAAPMLVDGERRWVEFEALHADDSDFPQLRADYEQETGLVRVGSG